MLINKFVSPEIIFGQGALEQVGDAARRLGASKVFVVSDPGVMEAGAVEKALPFLKQHSLDYTVWHNVSPNPKDYQAADGVEKYLEAGCDAVIAVGGGSAVDAAKAVALLATNGGKIHDYEGIDRINRPLPPLVAVPTTAGSGAEVSQFCVIVDSQRRLKMTIVSKSLVPDICLTDPLLLATVDAELTAYTGMDALTHAIEAYTSLAATFLTDPLAFGIPEKLSSVGLQAEAIPLLSANAAVRDACLITNPRDVSARDVEAILQAAL